MRVRKKEMACRIKNGLSYLSDQRVDREEIIDSIIHYFTRLHGIGVAVKESEDSNKYTFMHYPYADCMYDGCYETTSVSTTVEFVKRWYSVITDVGVRGTLMRVEHKLGLPHWEDYLEEKPKYDGLRDLGNIDEWSEYAKKKHADELDVMCYIVPRGCGKSSWLTKAMAEYAENDVKVTRELYGEFKIKPVELKITFDIDKVIFNDPATIIFWKDGTKTVVKAQDGEAFDPEKGMAMAICKKTMGNTRDYYIQFKKHLKKYHKVAQCEPEKKTATDDKDCWIDRVTS